MIMRLEHEADEMGRKTEDFAQTTNKESYYISSNKKYESKNNQTFLIQKKVGIEPKNPDEWRLRSYGNEYLQNAIGGASFQQPLKDRVYDVAKSTPNMPQKAPKFLGMIESDISKFAFDPDGIVMNVMEATNCYPEVDHIVPKEEMGGNSYANARLISKRSNDSGDIIPRPIYGQKNVRFYTNLNINAGSTTPPLTKNAGESMGDIEFGKYFDEYFRKAQRPVNDYLDFINFVNFYDTVIPSPDTLAQPPANAAQPPANAAQPPANAAQPPANAAQPPANAAQPPANKRKIDEQEIQ